MKAWILLSVLTTTACNSGSGGSNNEALPPQRPSKPPTEPAPPTEPDEFTDYESSLSLIKFSRQVKTSDVPAIEDYLTYLNGIAENWLIGRDSGYVPTTYLATYDPENIEYVDTTKGAVKGIDKLEPIRRDILNKCPVLSDPRYSCPLAIWWQENDTNILGTYVPGGTLVDRIDGEFVFFAGIGEGTKPRSRLIMNGKNGLYDYPKQTTIEIGKPWGIDLTLTHELGHHLTQCIDENLGRSSYQTFQFSESFATTIETICNPYSVDNPASIEAAYDRHIRSLELRKRSLSREREVINGTQGKIRYMESCIAHEKYHNKFDANTFAAALIEAYEKVEGRHLNPNPYPIEFKRGGTASSQWNVFALNPDPIAVNYQPFVVTRVEFLERFLEVYDCGLANELIQADIEGQLKFEW